MFNRPAIFHKKYKKAFAVLFFFPLVVVDVGFTDSHKELEKKKRKKTLTKKLDKIK